MYDVAIVGAGIAGASCARELSRYALSVLVVEAGSDVAQGATRANSGIVHGGYDPVPGTLKARYNVEGSHMYPQLAAELGFSFKNNGSLVVAFSESERPHLEALMERGIANGVSGLCIAERDELHVMEPNLSEAAVAALVVPTGGIVNPYGACLALMENAVENGVELQLLTRVANIEKLDGAFRLTCEKLPLVPDAEHRTGMDAPTPEGTCSVEARIVINAAGAFSGVLNDMVSAEHFEITPRIGEYHLMDTEFGGAFSHTVFQTPTANGKGVLITPTTGGNLLVGPDAIRRERLDDTATDTAGLEAVLAAARKTWPDLPRGFITNFAGTRSSCLEHPDFILGEPSDAPGFFNIGGFDSPGLTAAPAVGREYARVIAERLHAEPNPDFNPNRTPAPRFNRADRAEQARLAAEDPAFGHVVCRCECVTEGDIVAAVHSPVPALTADAVKWRTRAGMGRCQGGFCLPQVASIIARERGIDATDVAKSAPGSWIALGRRGCVADLPHVVLPGEGE
ncbi:L-2-hydroxyglutarate oxidase LhgO [Slackia heliotrinireducens]|uniref:Predicted dehydrogenase n=1 Tax=Slackia heliotrinireducens (strain ATCC 29202 / DSM 20476 / NCTC 11029 / RHS 1) TaxID=471855 RepID=C7N3U5_SLAHD|nr:NAD(P)/FAD-dependent oxidoreductase [Slackia heliotrinireducens]ACV21686.1 predicted dehydrogenase [Slackia heliotrinireducens DSM 20476]VEG99313.1 L-2-hydroxyglutarate oxidase LhgO [Slackia heliotrinireducens]